jgi:hypothetical protein
MEGLIHAPVSGRLPDTGSSPAMGRGGAGEEFGGFPLFEYRRNQPLDCR